jgi:hypothetical protein
VTEREVEPRSAGGIAMPLNLRTGVLVVGSLDWESTIYGGAFVATLDPVRSNWRKTRLKVDKRSTQYVRVPIRYGRLSESRGNTYTMVFSPELGPRLGVSARTEASRHWRCGL